MNLYHSIPNQYKCNFCNGIWRFYCLDKYKRIEKNNDYLKNDYLKYDLSEGYLDFNKNPVAGCSYGNISFHLGGISPNPEYLSQCYIMCFSKTPIPMSNDCTIYEIQHDSISFWNHFFSKKMYFYDDVTYYNNWSDIKFSTNPLQSGKEYVFHKQNVFIDQNEFRVCFFLNNKTFIEKNINTITFKRDIYYDNKAYELSVDITRGQDSVGDWYIDMDFSKFVREFNVKFDECQPK